MRNSIFLVLVVAAVEVGCGAKLPSLKPFKMDVQQGNLVTSKMLLQLRPGMTRSQVRYVMGTPLIVDSFRDNRWDYFYELRKQGQLVEKRRVILDFDKDALVSVRGDVVPEDKNTASTATTAATPVVAAATVSKSETAPSERSWLDTLMFWKRSPSPANASAANTTTVQTANAKSQPSKPEKSIPTDASAIATNQTVSAAAIAASTPLPAQSEQAPTGAPAAVPDNKTTTAPEAIKPAAVQQPETALVAPVTPASGTVAQASPADSAVSSEPLAKEVASVDAPPPVVLPTVSAVSESPSVQSRMAAPAVASGSVVTAVSAPVKPVAAAPTQVSNYQAVEVSIVNWAEAWRSKNVDAYLAAYAKDFVPEGSLDRKAWEAQRKQRLSDKQSNITLEISGMQVRQEGELATVTFEQRYTAKTFRDQSLKTMQLRYSAERGQWLITRELTGPLNTKAQRLAEIGAAGATANINVAIKNSADSSRAGNTAAATDASVATAIPAASASDAVIESAVQSWAQAWRSKNVSVYLAAYAPEFVPDGLPNRALWEAQRKQRLSTRQGDISLELGAIAIRREGADAIATFSQKYASNAYRDEMIKTLRLRFYPAKQAWLIVREVVANERIAPQTKRAVTAPEGTAEHLDGVLEQIGF